MEIQDFASGIPQEIQEMVRPKIIAFLGSLSQKQIKQKTNMFREQNKLAKKGVIVFAGDSITEGYALNEFFPNVNSLYNRGIGGISAVHILENIDAHILDLMPKKLFLMIGTNDLGGNCSVENTAENIRKICEKTEEVCPEAIIYLLSVYPVDNSKGDLLLSGETGRTNENIRELNGLLSGIPGVSYIDLYSKLADESGVIKDEYTTDGIHLSTEGYKVVTENLLSFLE